MKKILAVLLLLLILINASACALAEAQPAAEGEASPAILADVMVSFGDASAPYALHLYDCDTAVELYRSIPQSGQNLPIYDFDGYEGWESFQYYDIPSYYTIPDGDQQLISAEKAGEVYYSAPNRLILFYQDAEIPMTMMKIGSFDDTPEFRNAVQSNAPLEYWGNLIIRVAHAD